MTLILLDTGIRYILLWLLVYEQVAGLFNEAAKLSPDDADVHVVLGVLYNLSREFDKAIGAFRTALDLKPRDYSLWNKLGATQANSVQSADAILAYQQVICMLPSNMTHHVRFIKQAR